MPEPRKRPVTVLHLGRVWKRRNPGKYDNVPDADLGQDLRSQFPATFGDVLDVEPKTLAPFPTTPKPAGARPKLIPQGTTYAEQTVASVPGVLGIKDEPPETVAITAPETPPARRPSAGATREWAEAPIPADLLRTLPRPGKPPELAPQEQDIGVLPTAAMEAAETVAEIPKGIASGLSSTLVGTTGGAYQALGALTGSDYARDLGVTISDYDRVVQRAAAMPEDLQADPLDDPTVMSDPRWWAHIGGSLSSMVPMMLSGLGSVAAVEKLAKAGKLSGAALQVARRVAAPGAAATTEGLISGSLTFDEAVRAGATDEDAAKAAATVAAGTAATTAGSTALGIFAPAGGRMAPRMLRSAGAESAEEATQEVLQNLSAQQFYEPERPLTSGVVTAATAGALGGAGMSAVAGAGRPQAEPAPQIEERAADIAAAAPETDQPVDVSRGTIATPVAEQTQVESVETPAEVEAAAPDPVEVTPATEAEVAQPAVEVKPEPEAEAAPVEDKQAIYQKEFEAFKAKDTPLEAAHKAALEKAGLTEEQMPFVAEPDGPRGAAPTAETPTAGAPVIKGASDQPLPLRGYMTRTTDRFRDAFGQSTLSDMYSGFKNVAVRNLSKLENVSEPATTAAMKAAAPKAQAAAAWVPTWLNIDKTLQGSGVNRVMFHTALVEGRLRGLRQRWADLAESVRRSGDEELLEQFDGNFYRLLQEIKGRKDIPNNVAQAALALRQQGDAVNLRNLLETHFQYAHQNVGRMMMGGDLNWFDKTTGNPKFKEALRIYKENLEKPMAQSHASNEGVFSDALGDLDTYVPLIPMDKDGKAGRFAFGRKTPYKRPKNAANHFATGLAEEYDISSDAFRDRLGAAFRVNSKADMLQTLRDEGMLVFLEKDQDATPEISVWGQDVPARAVDVGTDRLVTSGGETIFVPSRKALVPDWLSDELKPIIEGGDWRNKQGRLARIRDAVNAFALVGPLDTVYHARNVLGTLASNTPFLGEKLMTPTNILGNTPVTKLVRGAIQALTVDPTTEESAAIIRELADIGALPSRFGSETFSRRWVDVLGAEDALFRLARVGATGKLGRLGIPTSIGPMLYGPKGLDIRARIMMYRVAKNISPDASPRELSTFVNQLGNYTFAMQGKIERGLKGSGFSPWYTAGSTMVRNGINAVLGTTPIPSGKITREKALTYRVAQQLTGGLIGTAAIWMLAHAALRDKWPWEDKESRLLKLPVPQEFRESDLGRQIFGSKKGTAYVDMIFFNPVLSRGLRALGVSGAYDAAIVGASPGQVWDEARRSSVNTFMHPVFSGPIGKQPFIWLAGGEPYITSFRDITGQPGLKFFPGIAKAPPGWPTLAQRITQSGLAMNDFMQDAAAYAGFGHEADEVEEEGYRLLRGGMDLLLPGLAGRVYDAERREAYFAKQQKSIMGPYFRDRLKAAMLSRDTDRRTKVMEDIRRYNTGKSRTMQINPLDVSRAAQKKIREERGRRLPKMPEQEPPDVPSPTAPLPPAGANTPVPSPSSLVR